MHVYKIECSANGKVYIGQSVNVEARLANHRKKLRDGNHYNQYLQTDYNQYGIDAFSFVTIAEATTLAELDDLEVRAIVEYDSRNSDNGYNILNGPVNRNHTSTRKPKPVTPAYLQMKTKDLEKVIDRLLAERRKKQK